MSVGSHRRSVTAADGAAATRPRTPTARDSSFEAVGGRDTPSASVDKRASGMSVTMRRSVVVQEPPGPVRGSLAELPPGGASPAQRGSVAVHGGHRRSVTGGEPLTVRPSLFELSAGEGAQVAAGGPRGSMASTSMLRHSALGGEMAAPRVSFNVPAEPGTPTSQGSQQRRASGAMTMSMHQRVATGGGVLNDEGSRSAEDAAATSRGSTFTLAQRRPTELSTPGDPPASLGPRGSSMTVRVSDGAPRSVCA
jgi:hypothetical protein